MKRHCRTALFLLAACALFMLNPGHDPHPLRAAPIDDKNTLPPKTPQAWKLDEALEQLSANPHDPYLQYVVLQLARRENRLEEIASKVEGEAVDPRRAQAGERHSQVDLFSMFTGALAVQESLQLDTMRGNRLRGTRATDPAALDKRRKERVAVSTLTGPEIKSHPWEQMLSDKKPAISPLAKYVPDDFFFAEFHSLTKLIDITDLGDRWGAHVSCQAMHDAQTQGVGDRIKKQLAVATDPLARPFYDLVVEEVAITGSDLFFGEGSDVTLLFRFKQPDLFRARMESFLAKAHKDHPDAVRTTGDIQGVSYIQLSTPDREVNVFAAYPVPGLHVRSNSKVALQRVIEAIKGKDAEGKAVRRLGDTPEFAYIRTLMPRGAKEEDGFVYLSDPFIRRLVGPQVKLTERRRMLCYNHLRMIGHAALMYRTEFGKAPESLAALAKAQCSPGMFGEDMLSCPEGGKYTLSPDGRFAMCAQHGHVHALTPCCEIPVSQVTGEEADEYNAFLEEYNQYWKTYFDPIAIRIQATPQRYRLETIILPLIDDSIYSGMAKVFGGRAEALDTLPVPKGNIMSVAVRFNKEEALKEFGDLPDVDPALLKQIGVPEKEAQKAVKLHYQNFLLNGLGRQIGFHVYDSAPIIDLNLLSILGEALGQTNGSGNLQTNIYFGLLLPALVLVNSPVYVSLPIQDVKIVDQFLDDLDKVLPVLTRSSSYREGPLEAKADFYELKHQGKYKVRCAGVRLGPIKVRFFWTRIGNGLYLAGKPFILDDLMAAEAEQASAIGVKETADPGPVGHAMFRVRPQNWNLVLPEFRMDWAEHNREACLNNLSHLANVGRASPLAGKKDVSLSAWSADVQRQADQLYAVHFFCPDGGKYELSADGKTCTCTVHGSVEEPRQAAAPEADSDLGKLLRDFTGLTGTLTFMEDGLHAVVVLERK